METLSVSLLFGLRPPQIVPYDRHVSQGEGEAPHHPDHEEGTSSAPEDEPFGVDGDGEDVPAVLDLQEDLTAEHCKDQPRVPTNGVIGITSGGRGGGGRKMELSCTPGY